jgi:hypothetical protein
VRRATSDDDVTEADPVAAAAGEGRGKRADEGGVICLGVDFMMNLRFGPKSLFTNICPKFDNR